MRDLKTNNITPTFSCLDRENWNNGMNLGKNIHEKKIQENKSNGQNVHGKKSTDKKSNGNTLIIFSNFCK